MFSKIQTLENKAINITQPVLFNLCIFIVLIIGAPVVSADAQFFSVLTIAVIFVFSFEPFKLVLIYTLLIFYRDIFSGEVLGIKTELVEYLTFSSNYVFILMLASLVIYAIQIQWSALLWPIAIFVGFMTVSCLMSTDPVVSLQVLIRLFQLVGYFFILFTLLNSEQRVYQFIFLLLGVFTIVIVVSGYNFMFNPNRLAHLARFMIFPALASGLFVYMKKNPQHRRVAWWVLGIAMIGSISLLITESRRVLMAIAIGWAFFLIMSSSRFGSVIFIVILFCAGLFYSPDVVLVRFQKTATAVEALQSQKGLDEEEAFDLFTGRDKLWELGLEKFYEKPIVGIGLGVSRVVVGERFGEQLRLHNVYLEMLVETGIVGFLAFIFLLLSFLNLCIKMIRIHARTKNFYYYMGMILLSIILIFYLTNYFGGASVFEKFEWVFYAILAACFRLGNFKLMKPKLNMAS